MVDRFLSTADPFVNDASFLFSSRIIFHVGAFVAFPKLFLDCPFIRGVCPRSGPGDHLSGL